MRRRGMRPVINSIKNSAVSAASSGTTIAAIEIANAVSSPDNTVVTQVENGCSIRAIWISLDFCGLAGTGVRQSTGVYLFKNPGSNLTPPSPFSVGVSNEKNYVIKEWSQMTMRNQDGNPPYHWEGWIKIPKSRQRMATDDTWTIQFITDTAAGHMLVKWVYKWFS